MLFHDTLEDHSLPPSYSEALYLPLHSKPSTLEPEKTEELEPKLCRMRKSSGTFGFHLNGLTGQDGHFISEVRSIKTTQPTAKFFNSEGVFLQVVEDRAADRAGIKDNDILMEVNGVNVEDKSHDEVVEMIRCSGNSLEMLVATKSVYDQLKGAGLNTTSQRFGERPEVQVQSTETNRDEKHQQDSRPETPTEGARARVSDLCVVLRI